LSLSSFEKAGNRAVAIGPIPQKGSNKFTPTASGGVRDIYTTLQTPILNNLPETWSLKVFACKNHRAPLHKYEGIILNSHAFSPKLVIKTF
jgi:hypothetical protein